MVILDEEVTPPAACCTVHHCRWRSPTRQTADHQQSRRHIRTSQQDTSSPCSVFASHIMLTWWTPRRYSRAKASWGSESLAVLWARYCRGLVGAAATTARVAPCCKRWMWRTAAVCSLGALLLRGQVCSNPSQTSRQKDSAAAHGSTALRCLIGT
jgi:hypothetical protein